MTLTGQPSGAVVVVTSDDAGALTVMVSAVSDAASTNETVTVNVTDNTSNRNRFEPGLGGATISFAPTELFSVVGTQSLTTRSSGNQRFFAVYSIHVCPWTSVPQTTGSSVSGCAIIANRVAGNSITRNVSVTQAMVTNGGFVLIVKQAVGPRLTILADWVPLVTPRTPTLSSAPTAAVTLTVGASAVAGDFMLSAAGTLTAVDNAVDAADKRVTGSVASTDRRVINPTAATPTTTDDDTAGVEVDTDPSTPAVADTAALAVTEDGTTTTDTYTVVLATEPTGPVTVSDDTTTTPGVNDLDKVSAVPGALTFSTTNWATAQTVTHTATSSDSNYTIAPARPAENITVADNDTPGLAVNPTALMLTEQDATAGSGTYTVRLNALPSGMPRSRPRHP